MRAPALITAFLLAGGLLPALADEGLVTRAHDVGALLEHPVDRVAPVLGLLDLSAPLADDVLLPWERGDVDDEPPPPYLDPDSLQELLGVALPGFGEAPGEVAEVLGHTLLVTASGQRQEAVAAVLKGFWADAATRIRIDVDLLTFADGASSRLESSGLLDALRRGALDARARARLLEAAGSGAARLSTLVPPGRRRWVGELESRSFVQDYSVEIAQDSVVGDPVVQTVHGGWAVEVRPFPLLGGGVVLDLWVQGAGFEDPVRRAVLGVQPFGSLDFPACRVLRAATRLSIRPGETRVVLVGDGADLRALLLRAELVAPARAPTVLERLATGALTAPAEGLAFVRAAEDAGLRPRMPAVRDSEALAPSGDELAEQIRSRVDPSAWEGEHAVLTAMGNSLLLAGPAALRAKVRPFLVDLERDLLRTRRVSVDLVTVDDPAQTLATASLDLTRGVSALVQLGRERSYLADWAVEVAQEARMGDPETRTVFGGLELGLRLGGAPAEGYVGLELTLAYADLAEVMERREPKSECTGFVELPRVRRLGFDEDLVVPVGKPLLRELGRLGDGRVVALRILVEPAGIPAER